MADEDGQKIPIIGSFKKPINIIQKQVNESLKVMSPCEKMRKYAIKPHWMKQNVNVNWINYEKTSQH